MPHFINPSISFYTYFILILLSVLIYTGCQQEWKIFNPYENVDWQNDEQFKGNFHAHTILSDGRINPHTSIDKYHELGYSILAITDHNKVTYPWTDISHMRPDNRYVQRNKMHIELGDIKPEEMSYESRNPTDLGIIAVQGNELTHPPAHPHMNTFFSGHKGSTRIEKNLEAVTADNGFIIWNHPMSASTQKVVSQLTNDRADWFANWYTRYENLIGQEMNNSKNDHLLWDAVLSRLMPERPVWGFSNDDSHTIKSIGKHWNMVILPELTHEWVKRGMKEGRFFFVYAPEGHDGLAPPEIKSIHVDKKQGTIRVNASGYKSIKWISDGKVISNNTLINFKELPNVDGYVRAVLYAEDGETYIGTQPFGIQRSSSANSENIANGFSEKDTIFTEGKGVTDIDGNNYKTVVIGNQEWMAENLKVTHFNDGTSIDYPGKDYSAWKKNRTGAYAWYDNNNAQFAEAYGALYNWYAVDNESGLCPSGWRIPTDDDWKQLEMYLGMSYEDANSAGWDRSNYIGNLLKSNRSLPDAHPRWKKKTEDITNKRGFSALPGGYRSSNGLYDLMGDFGHWWTSNEYNSSYAWNRQLESNYADVSKFALNKVYGFSVRCVEE